MIRTQFSLGLLLAALFFLSASSPCSAGVFSLLPDLGMGKGSPAGNGTADQDDLLPPDRPAPSAPRESARSSRLLLATGFGREVFAYDVAIVPFRGSGMKDKDGGAYAKIEAAFAGQGLRVAPRGHVVAALRRLGLLSSDALARQDFDAVADDVSARYVVTGAIRTLSASLGLNAGTFLLGSLRFAAAGGAVRGGFNSGLFLAAGALGFVAAGITMSASAALDAQIYDRQFRKTIWTGSQSRSSNKHFLALFARKRRMRERALSAAVTALFQGVVPQLARGAVRAGEAGRGSGARRPGDVRSVSHPATRSSDWRPSQA